MTDDILVEVITDLDNNFSEMIEKYKLNPLAFTSIILARILLINENCGTGDDFRQLISEVVLKTTPPKSQPIVH